MGDCRITKLKKKKKKNGTIEEYSKRDNMDLIDFSTDSIKPNKESVN
jgi:hypothetical protein